MIAPLGPAKGPPTYAPPHPLLIDIISLAAPGRLALPPWNDCSGLTKPGVEASTTIFEPEKREEEGRGGGGRWLREYMTEKMETAGKRKKQKVVRSVAGIVKIEQT
jgi:hypothetical protein